MSRFRPGVKSRRMKLTMKSFVTEEAWGEIWRAEHEEYGPIFLITYTPGDGVELFKRAREKLEQWQKLTLSGVDDASTDGFLKIHEIIFEAKRLPALIVEDPGGRTMREAFAFEEKVVMKATRAIVDCARMIESAGFQQMLPLGFTPDTIVEDPSGESFPWRVIPIGPGDPAIPRLLAGGRYAPPALDEGFLPNQINADTYALSWLWAESIAQDFASPHDPQRLEQYVPYPRLRAVVDSGMDFRGGMYVEIRQLQAAAELWIKNDARDDREDYEAQLEAEEEEAARAKAAGGAKSEKTRSKPKASEGAKPIPPAASPSRQVMPSGARTRTPKAALQTTDRATFNRRLVSALVDLGIVILIGCGLGAAYGNYYADLGGFSLEDSYSEFYYARANLEHFYPAPIFGSSNEPPIGGLESNYRWAMIKSGAFWGLVFFIVFYGLIEGVHGASPGKMLLRIRVRNEDGAPASAGQIFRRTSEKHAPLISLILSWMFGFWLLGLVGWVLMFVLVIYFINVIGDQRMALHDKETKTAVFPAPSPDAGAKKRKKSKAAREAPLSRKAFWALVLGVLSFPLSIITGLAALVLSIWSLIEIPKLSPPMEGKRHAWWGLGTSLVGMILVPLLLIYAILPWQVGRHKRDYALFVEEARASEIASEMFSGLFDGVISAMRGDPSQDFVPTDRAPRAIRPLTAVPAAPSSASGATLPSLENSTPERMPQLSTTSESRTADPDVDADAQRADTFGFGDLDSEQPSILQGFLVIFGLVAFLFVLFYLFPAICFHKIMVKTDNSDLWMAWFPMFNWVLTPWKVSGRPGWWLACMIVVPIVGWIMAIIAVMEMIAARGKSPLLVILFIFVPWVPLAILAYSE